MQLKTLLNSIEHHKGFVYGAAKLTKSHGKWQFRQKAIIIPIEHRKNSAAICSGCNVTGSGYDRLPERLWDYIPILGIAVYFAYARRRVDCAACGVTAETIPWASGNRQITESLCWFLASWAKILSWSEVAVRFRSSWDSVYRAVERAVEWGLANRNMNGIESLGVDEIARAKGHRYLTLVYQIDQGVKRLLWIGNERKESTLVGFFDWFGSERAAGIKAICSDMWKPYLKVIKERLPAALHVLDRFHIVANLNKVLDQVRAGEARKMASDGYEPLLTKTKWLLLRCKGNLKDKQKGALKKLLQYNLQTVRAYLLKEDFQQLWSYTSVAWASKFIDQWTTMVMKSRIDPMKKQAQSIRRHKPLILNWFRAKGKLSSGIVEGLNTKAKLTSRKSYGFRSSEVHKIALYHTLGELPTPEWTHKFC
jgi:transposase